MSGRRERFSRLMRVRQVHGFERSYGPSQRTRTVPAMRSPHVDDLVRLNQDIPELELHSGELGIVRSTWFAPTVAYEVEFLEGDASRRALLLERQVTIE